MRLIFVFLLFIVTINGQTTHPYNLKTLSVREFMRFDRDHDGIITISEWETVLKSDDNNGDGQVSCEEYVLHSSSPTKEIALGVLNQFDGGDCRLTHDEAMVPFHHMDGNGDGMLQENEFVNFYTQVLMRIGLTDTGHSTTAAS